MKKLKKLSKNKPLFNLIMIYGTPAVGKLTVANELQKITGYKFLHNHHTHDLVRILFESDTLEFHKTIEDIRFLIFKEIGKAKLNAITTLAYDPSFVSKTGITDQNYMKKIESIIKKAGGIMLSVHLVADRDEILKRVTGNSRKKYKKLKDVKKMKEILDKNEWKISAPVKNNFIIDNTKLSPKKVAKIIKKHFNL